MINRNEKIAKIFLALLIFGIILLTSSFVSSYISTDFTTSRSFGISGGIPLNFDSSMCIPGQDFFIQIDPSGCTPSVVRSDLLEEENVPVFCPLLAAKTNPLIDVNTIERITFQGQ